MMIETERSDGGSLNDMFGNLMDYHVINAVNKNKGSKNTGGCCSEVFLLMLVTLPVWASVVMTLF